jgi:predicted AlkP superfamily phosphohydrolase/phosphomutase
LERLTDHLLKEGSPQICFVVARDVDELQHFFWDVLTGPDKHGYRPLVEDYFAGLDRYLTRLLDWAGEDARIILFSDHGFGPVEGIWHLNDWLRARGFLRLKAEFEDRTDRKDLSLSTRLNFALRSRLLRELKHLGMPADRLEHSLEKLRFRGQRHTDLEGIDWSSTLAYAGAVGEEWLPVYINLQGREPQGIVSPQQYDQIREDLRSALYSSEEPAVLVVHRAEEIFEIQDPRMTAAPDLIAETITSAVQSDFTLGNAQIYEKSRFRNGCHRRLGMFLLAGPEVVHQRDVAHLLDIPATILAWLGITPPTIFQGRIMHELIPEAPLPETETEIQTAQVHKDYFSEEDETGVRKKLESLGYL